MNESEKEKLLLKRFSYQQEMGVKGALTFLREQEWRREDGKLVTIFRYQEEKLGIVFEAIGAEKRQWLHLEAVRTPAGYTISMDEEAAKALFGKRRLYLNIFRNGQGHGPGR